MESHFFLLILIGIIGATVAETNYCPPPENPTACSCYHGLFYGGNGTRVDCSLLNSTETLYQSVQNLRGYHVDYFNLVHSNFTHLPPGLFSGTSIKRILIQDTDVKNLTSTKLSPFDGLENSLEELNIQFVKNPTRWLLPDLKSLTKLETFVISMAQVDYVGHNFVEIDGGSLDTIAVTYAGVNRIHPQAFSELKNMKAAIFPGNNIPYLVRTMFPNPAPRLEMLSFSGNKLFTLNENMFENMPALNYLGFADNKFKSFESNVFKPVWNKLQTFYISVNPFRCDCSLIPLQQWFFSGSHPPYHDLDYVFCKNPGDPDQTNLKDLDGKSMHC